MAVLSEVVETFIDPFVGQIYSRVSSLVMLNLISLQLSGAASMPWLFDVPEIQDKRPWGIIGMDLNNATFSFSLHRLNQISPGQQYFGGRIDSIEVAIQNNTNLTVLSWDSMDFLIPELVNQPGLQIETYFNQFTNQDHVIYFGSSRETLEVFEFAVNYESGWELKFHDWVFLDKMPGSVSAFRCSLIQEQCVFALDTNLLATSNFTYSNSTSSWKIDQSAGIWTNPNPIPSSSPIQSVMIGNSYVLLHSTEIGSGFLIYKDWQNSDAYAKLSEEYGNLPVATFALNCSLFQLSCCPSDASEFVLQGHNDSIGTVVQISTLQLSLSNLPGDLFTTFPVSKILLNDPQSSLDFVPNWLALNFTVTLRIGTKKENTSSSKLIVWCLLGSLLVILLVAGLMIYVKRSLATRDRWIEEAEYTKIKDDSVNGHSLNSKQMLSIYNTSPSKQ